MSNMDSKVVELEKSPDKKTLDWIIQNRIWLFWAAILLVVSLLTSFFIYSNQVKREADFIHFESIKANLLAADGRDLIQFEPYAKKYPELREKIQAMVLHARIINRETEAELIAPKRTFATPSPLQNLHQKFSMASLLIEEKQYGEALVASLDLKESLLANHSLWNESQMNRDYGTQLFLFNLLRIATLYREIGKVSDEIAAIDELKRHLGYELDGLSTPLEPKAIANFEHHFADGHVSLRDFISFRESVLRR